MPPKYILDFIIKIKSIKNLNPNVAEKKKDYINSNY